MQDHTNACRILTNGFCTCGKEPLPIIEDLRMPEIPPTRGPAYWAALQDRAPLESKARQFLDSKTRALETPWHVLPHDHPIEQGIMHTGCAQCLAEYRRIPYTVHTDTHCTCTHTVDTTLSTYEQDNTWHTQDQPID